MGKGYPPGAGRPDLPDRARRGRIESDNRSRLSERLRRASALFDQRRFAESAEEARRARELDPKLRPAWRLRGLSLQLAGRAPEAEREFALRRFNFSRTIPTSGSTRRVQYLQSSLKPAETSARRALALAAGSRGRARNWR